MDSKLAMQAGMIAIILAICAVITSGFLVVSGHQMAGDTYDEGGELFGPGGNGTWEDLVRLGDEHDSIYEAISFGGLLGNAGMALGLLGAALVVLSIAERERTEESSGVLRGISGTIIMFMLIATALVIAGSAMNHLNRIEESDASDWEARAECERGYVQGNSMITLGLTLMLYTILSLAFVLDRWMGLPEAPRPRSPYP
jgi:hypothetical protein